jgi:hypothetical protein
MPRPPASADGPKNVTIGIRITPKMRFGLELMSRLHGRPMAEVVSYAIEEVFSSEIEGLWDDQGAPEAGGKRPLLSLLWAERASDRLANIALQCPQLLTNAERRMWARIERMPELWSGAGGTEVDLKRDVLEEQWPTIQQQFSLGSRDRP